MNDPLSHWSCPMLGCESHGYGYEAWFRHLDFEHPSVAGGFVCDDPWADTVDPLGADVSLTSDIEDLTPEGRTSSTERIIDRAWGLVMGPRQSSYGHPADDFEATGRMWGAILTNWLKPPDGQVPDVDPRIVALMLACVKISRETHAPKQDNRDDLVGYAICADRIANGY